MASGTSSAFGPGDEHDALAPQQFCFERTVAESSEDVPGRMWTTRFQIDPGHSVRGLLVDSTRHDFTNIWLLTDDDGSIFERTLEANIYAADDRFTSVSVAIVGDPATALCRETPVEFDLTIGCIEREGAPFFIRLDNDGGHNLLKNPAMALTSYDPPSADGNQRTFTGRISDTPSGRVLCTEDSGANNGQPPDAASTADTGWWGALATNPNNGLFNRFEVWPRWQDGRSPASGDGGAFEFYDVTDTPNGAHAFAINAWHNNGFVWQTFTVQSEGDYRIGGIFGGQFRDDEISVNIRPGGMSVAGSPEPAIGEQGSTYHATLTARNVCGRTGPPGELEEDQTRPTRELTRGAWTHWQDTVHLTPGIYSVWLMGPPQADPARSNYYIGGLVAEFGIYSVLDVEHIMTRDDSCVFTKVTPEHVETQCEWWQPSVDDDDEVSSWRRLSDGVTHDNDAFWALDPPPICCTGNGDPIEFPEHPDVDPGWLISSAVVCAEIAGERRSIIRTAAMTQSGRVIWERFVDDGVQVFPRTWEGGQCDECCPQVLGTGCWENGTDSGSWVSIRDGDGTVTITDPATGLVVDPADVVDCPGSAYRTEVRTVNANDSLVIPGSSTNLVSWSVRSRSGTVTLTVSGVNTAMDVGEVIESSTQDDRGVLEDTPSVATGAGASARISWTIRTEP